MLHVLVEISFVEISFVAKRISCLRHLDTWNEPISLKCIIASRHPRSLFTIYCVGEKSSLPFSGKAYSQRKPDRRRWQVLSWDARYMSTLTKYGDPLWLKTAGGEDRQAG